MKTGKILVVIVLCLCLCGCDFMSSGSHIFVETRHPQNTSGAGQNVGAENYEQLYAALTEMIENGTAQQVISVAAYDKEALETDVDRVVEDICTGHPIAAYAVEQIRCTIGTSGGVDALSVEISYLHDKAEIRQIIYAPDNAVAEEAIASSLFACDAGIVVYIRSYTDADFTQIIEDFTLAYPEYVMERPQVAVSIYPQKGESRVVELKFSYHTSRDSLKTMQSQVEPVFESAVLYVSGDAAEQEKYSQLYSFLMERYEYTIETSITPTYSLLRHGVGDSRAFSAVYAAMCRQAGLECMVVSGTYAGESRYWNIVAIDGVYYHIDLLHSSQAGMFLVQSDKQMRIDGYLWNFDAYPACGDPELLPEETTPPEENNEN